MADTFTEVPQGTMSTGSSHTTLVRVLVVLLVLLIAAAGYLYSEKIALQKNPNKVTDEKVAQVVAKVSKLITVPEGETPTVLTVSDVEKLKGQPFFANAKNGDQVLFYATAKKIYLYDPTQDIIVQVASLNIGN